MIDADWFIFFNRLRDLTEDKRKEILDHMKSIFCFHCGRIHEDDEFPCQCWNDE